MGICLRSAKVREEKGKRKAILSLHVMGKKWGEKNAN